MQDCDVREQSLEIDSYSLIGNTGVFTNLWYEISEENKKNLPFGNHVKEAEKENCKEILLTTYSHNSDYTEKTSVSLLFFIDSRTCGIGGCIAKVEFETGTKSGKDAWKELVEKAEVILDKLQLKLSKERLLEDLSLKIKGIAALNNEVEFLKQLQSAS